MCFFRCAILGLRGKEQEEKHEEYWKRRWKEILKIMTRMCTWSLAQRLRESTRLGPEA